MTHYRKLKWTQPDPGSYHAVTPMSAGGLCIHYTDGQWWCSWDPSLPGSPSAAALIAAGQKAHEDWLQGFVDIDAKTEEAALTQDWLAGRIRRLKDYGESRGVWPEIEEILKAEVNLGDEPPSYERRLATARHKASEAEKRADKHARKARDLRRRVNKLEGQIEDAVQAVSSTSPSWKHHLYAAMSALGYDYGDPDWELPDQRKRNEHLQARLNDAEAKLMGMHALREGLEECRRLASGGTHNMLETLQAIETASQQAIENCSLMEYPMMVTVAVQSLSWIREEREDIKFPSYQAVDPVYGAISFRITQVEENGLCFMVANGHFSKHPDIQDAKFCAEEISRKAVQEALLPHIRVRARSELEAEPTRAAKSVLAAAPHSAALASLDTSALRDRLEQVEDLLTSLRFGWPITDCEERALVQVGGPVAAQLRHAVHSHDLGAAYDALLGRLLLDGSWKLLEFENTSETTGWVCRLVSAQGQEVSSSMGQDDKQDSPARAMVCAMLWGMRLELRRALGEADEPEAEAA